jgi:nickel-dependent lactate racemase
MRKFELPYGKTVQSLEIPDYIKLALILPNEIIAHENPVHLVEKSLDNPIGEFNFSTFQNARSVAIAINDKTRPASQFDPYPPAAKKNWHCWAFRKIQLLFILPQVPTCP